MPFLERFDHVHKIALILEKPNVTELLMVDAQAAALCIGCTRGQDAGFNWHNGKVCAESRYGQLNYAKKIHSMQSQNRINIYIYICPFIP